MRREDDKPSDASSNENAPDAKQVRQFDAMCRGFENVRRIMDGMNPRDAAIMHATAVETAINAYRREEITADQRGALLRLLNPDTKIIIVEPISE